MDVIKLAENGPALICPKIFKDERGYFFESFNEKGFKELVDNVDFVQDNESKSSYGVLRGMHFQKPPYAQAKLVRVVNGAVIDVVVDLRKDSPNYGQYYHAYLSGENHRQFYVPVGFAHGFVSLTDDVVFQYKCSNFYNKESEGSFYFLDPTIEIPWGTWVNYENFILSEKDQQAPLLKDIENPF